MFEGIAGSRTFRDDTREMVAYHYPGNMHNAGMLMVFLPKERSLIEADSFTPASSPNEPPRAVVNLAQFVEAVERLRLDVQQIIPIHGRLTTFDEARAAADTLRLPDVPLAPGPPRQRQSTESKVHFSGGRRRVFEAKWPDPTGQP